MGTRCRGLSAVAAPMQRPWGGLKGSAGICLCTRNGTRTARAGEPGKAREMTTETRTSKTVTRTLKISAGLCVGAIALGSAAVLVSSPAFAASTLPTPNAPTPTFTSNSTFTAPAGAVYEVPANGFHFNSLQNVTINGGTWVDPNTSPGDTHGHGAALGRAAFDILGGSGITLENMTIVGANRGGYNPKLAFNTAINADGTSGLTVSGDDVSHVFGDCLTLGGWYQGVDPNVTVTPDMNVTVTDFNGQVCGLQGIALVDVNGVTATNVTIGHSGEESLNFESDTVGIGAKNVTFTGCSLDKQVNIAAAGSRPGPSPSATAPSAMTPPVTPSSPPTSTTRPRTVPSSSTTTPSPAAPRTTCPASRTPGSPSPSRTARWLSALPMCPSRCTPPWARAPSPSVTTPSPATSPRPSAPLVRTPR